MPPTNQATEMSQEQLEVYKQAENSTPLEVIANAKQLVASFPELVEDPRFGWLDNLISKHEQVCKIAAGPVFAGESQSRYARS